METNFVTKYIPAKALDGIERALRTVAGDEGEKSLFQKAYDFFKNIKPNEKLVNAILAIVKYIFKVPDITSALLKGYQTAMNYQFMINANQMTPEDAGAKLREQLKQDLGSSKLVDFVFGAVMLALKVLKSE